MQRFVRPTAAAAVLFAAGFFIQSCKGSEQSTGSASGDVGGTLIISTAADARSMLPQLYAGITDRQVTDLLFDHLADIGQDMNSVGDKGFIPVLAQSWDWSADSLSITFHLNPKAKWHDGQPVRASDVAYSVRLTKDTALGSAAGPSITNVDSVVAKDSVTAVAYFKRHTPEQFFDLAYQVAIVPEHVLGSTAPGTLKTSDITRKPIGSGRFRLARWEPGTRIELVADTANYRGRAKLDRVIFAVAPDFNAAATRLFAHEADVFENLRAEHLSKVAADTGLKTLRLPSIGLTYLAFNAKDPKNPTRPHPILSDVAVRRALSMAADRRAMLKNVFDTLGVIAYGPFPHVLAQADTTLVLPPYDTTRAAALLDSAGWRRGADGIRVKNGQRLAFGITTPASSATRHAYAVLMQEAFRKIGAEVKIDEVDFPGYMQKLSQHSFDAEMASFNPDPSVSGFKQILSTSGISGEGNNFYSYSNPKVDALLDSAGLSFDPVRTKALARKAFEIIIADAPGIWLYEPPTVAGISKRVHPEKLRADAYFSGLADWWIPANERNERDKIGLRPTP
jgi:peptide/nickel transport system substrate-binding protein